MRRRHWIITVVLIVAAVAAYYRWSAPDAAAVNRARAPAAPPAVAVEAMTVTVGPLTETIQAVGSLQSNESVVIRSEIAGRIARISFTEGAKVRQGDVLVELDATTWRAELAQAEANLRLSEANYERAQSLLARGAVTARANDEARAKLQSDRAAVQLMRARLEKATIVAPFDGRLGLRSVSVGALVSPTVGLATPTDRLVNLESTDPLKVDFRLPEAALRKVEVGQRVSVTVDALPGRTFQGEIYAIDPLVDVAGRAIRLRARIPNADDALAPGLFARIAVAADVRENAISVPEAAIVPRDRERYVYRVENGRAILTKVELGARRTGQVEVVRGLLPGAVVVVAGQIKLRDGAAVEIVKQADAAPGPRT